MILKSFGCSFIYGSELDTGPAASDQTWPALLAKHLGLPYQCFATPGAGNTRIAERVLNQIALGEPALYVIGWTFIDRFDYRPAERNYWRTLTAWDQGPVAQHYYRDLHSQYLDKHNSLTQANLVLQQLQTHGCDFFMTYMDHLMFETEFHCSPAMRLMQQQLQPHMHSFDQQTFLEWSKSQGFEIGSKGNHPLHTAHRAAADYVIKHHNF